MKSFFSKCADCEPNCCGHCGPAAYDCSFSIMADPFDNNYWNVTIGGALTKVKIPPLKNIDTYLNSDYAKATLNYKSEYHEDIITGSQLGSIININDLRDINLDYDKDAMCMEFIYHKYGECGEGCQSLENAWQTFSIDDEGAKKDSIRYVRGANIYGCPEYLDVPSNLDQWWLAGWRLDGDHKKFGYFQATPKPNIDGNVLWVGNNGQINSSPMVSADNKIYTGFYRGNSAFTGGYYYPANSNYDIAIAPNSVHGVVTGIYTDSTHPSDATVSNVNQDVIALVRFCMDYSGGQLNEAQDKVWRITPYASGENRSEAMEKERAVHMETKTSAMACPGVTFLKIPKGQHLVLHVAGDQGQGNFRLHQINVMWLPANLVSTVDEIIQ